MFFFVDTRDSVYQHIISNWATEPNTVFALYMLISLGLGLALPLLLRFVIYKSYLPRGRTVLFVVLNYVLNLFVISLVFGPGDGGGFQMMMMFVNYLLMSWKPRELRIQDRQQKRKKRSKERKAKAEINEKIRARKEREKQKKKARRETVDVEAREADPPEESPGEGTRDP